MKRILFYDMRAEEEGRAPLCCTLAKESASVSGSSCFDALHVLTNDLEGDMSIDLGVMNKF